MTPRSGIGVLRQGEAAERSTVAAPKAAPKHGAERQAGAHLVRMAGHQPAGSVAMAKLSPLADDVDAAPKGGLEVDRIEAATPPWIGSAVDQLKDEADGPGPGDEFLELGSDR